MYLPLSSFADLPLPALEIDGIPEGHETPAISEDLFDEITRIAAAGESVSPIAQFEYLSTAFASRSNRIMRWQTGEANRATALGIFIDSELADGRTPALKVEKTVLRYGPARIRKATAMTQEIFYKFEGWDGEFSYRLFSQSAGTVLRVLGLVTVFKGDLCMFPFAGPMELGSQEATGEIVRLTIDPSRRGKLSFLLHANYCKAEMDRRGYCHNGPEDRRGWEADMRTSLVLAGREPFDPATFSPMSAEFSLRYTDGGAVVDGFYGDGEGNYGMLSRSVALESAERLAHAVDGYTDSRTLSLSKSADELFGGRDVADMPEEEVRRIAAMFQELVKNTRRQHETLSVEDFWKPAALRSEAAA